MRLGTVSATDGDGTTDITDITYTVTGIPIEFSFDIIAAAVQIKTNTSFDSSTGVSNYIASFD